MWGVPEKSAWKWDWLVHPWGAFHMNRFPWKWGSGDENHALECVSAGWRVSLFDFALLVNFQIETNSRVAAVANWEGSGGGQVAQGVNWSLKT